MKYHINFQYRLRNAARPQDEPMLDASGKLLDITMKDGGGPPAIGDHVIFCRTGHRMEDGKPVSETKQVEGVIESRLFVFFIQDSVGVNTVVTDSDTNSGLLIKQ